MRTLLFGMILYLAGVALVLFFRPQLMFHRDGRWREFGLADSDGGTMCPFWLFCIVWAALSYLIARVFVRDTHVLQHLQMPQMPQMPQMQSGPEPIMPLDAEPPMKPGYYRLNAAGSKKGIPRYVYVGPELPEE